MDYTTVDGYSFLGELYSQKEANYLAKYLNAPNPFSRGFRKFYTYWTKETRAVIVCLVLTGVVTGLIATLCEFSINALLHYRKQIIESITSVWELQFLLWIGWSVFFVAIAGFANKYITNTGNGSGIPEMKTIISGIDMPQYLSFKTLITKVLGLTCGQVADLYIGRVGPFVHVGACVCGQIIKLPFLSKIRDNYHLKMQMLAAACALGPAAVFGAPVGGVFFSIEVTATFFYVHSLWKGILCAVCAKIAHSYFRGKSQFLPGTAFSAIFAIESKLHPFNGVEFCILILAGVILSFIGAGFTVLCKRFAMFRARFTWWKTSVWGQLIITSLIVGSISYATNDLPFAGDSFKSLVTNKDLDVAIKEWELILALFVVGIIKFVLVIVCGTLPLPAGLFAPTVMLGAHYGRLIGEIVKTLFPHLEVNPAGYALIGMTAFPCAVTSTFSPAVITVETIGNLDYLVPCLLVSVIGYSIGEMVNHSLYSVMIRFRKMPFLSANVSPKFTGRLAYEVMDQDPKFLVIGKITPTTVKEILSQVPKEQTAIPVVLDNNNKELMGSVRRASVLKMLEMFDTDDTKDTQLKLLYRYQMTRHSLVTLREFPTEEHPEFKQHVADNLDSLTIPTDTKGWCQSCWDIKFDPDMVKEEKDKDSDKEDDDTVREVVELEPDVDEFDRPLETTGQTDNGSGVIPLETQPKLRRRGPTSTGPVAVKVEDSTRIPWIEFDPAPFQTTSHTPMVKIQYVFSMLTLTQVFLTHRGKLVGTITKKQLLGNPDRNDIPFGG